MFTAVLHRIFSGDGDREWLGDTYSENYQAGVRKIQTKRNGSFMRQLETKQNKAAVSFRFDLYYTRSFKLGAAYPEINNKITLFLYIIS